MAQEIKLVVELKAVAIPPFFRVYLFLYIFELFLLRIFKVGDTAIFLKHTQFQRICILFLPEDSQMFSYFRIVVDLLSQ